MEAFLYTLDVGLVLYLCRLVSRIDATKMRALSERLGPFSYKQDKDPS